MCFEKKAIFPVFPIFPGKNQFFPFPWVFSNFPGFFPTLNYWHDERISIYKYYNFFLYFIKIVIKFFMQFNLCVVFCKDFIKLVGIAYAV
jgi:hypothetical protein